MWMKKGTEFVQNLPPHPTSSPPHLLPSHSLPHPKVSLFFSSLLKRIMLLPSFFLFFSGFGGFGMVPNTCGPCGQAHSTGSGHCGERDSSAVNFRQSDPRNVLSPYNWWQRETTSFVWPLSMADGITVVRFRLQHGWHFQSTRQHRNKVWTGHSSCRVHLI